MTMLNAPMPGAPFGGPDDRVPTIFTFARRDFGTTELGPYLSQHEAKTAYQRLYGTWPADATSTRPWKATA